METGQRGTAVSVTPRIKVTILHNNLSSANEAAAKEGVASVHDRIAGEPCLFLFCRPSDLGYSFAYERIDVRSSRTIFLFPVS